MTRQDRDEDQSRDQDSDQPESLADACMAIRPLLFAAAEGEICREERLDVHAHLAVCAACRSWERGERALTALLVESGEQHAGAMRSRPAVAGAPRPAGAPRSALRRLAMVAAVLIGAMLVFVLPAATPRGVLVERTLGPERVWHVAQERAIRSQDVIEVPAAATVTLRLGDGGLGDGGLGDGVQLDSVGPARMALQTIDGLWQVTVDAGTVTATLTGNSQLLVGGDGAQRLSAGTWTLTRSRVERPAANREIAQAPAAKLTSATVVERLEAGKGAFSEGNFQSVYGGSNPELGVGNFAKAERLLRAVVESDVATPSQVQSALFYLAASVSRQGRREQAHQLERQWLRQFPNGSEASLMRFYVASYLRDHGDKAEAIRLFERISKEEGKSSLGQAARSYLSVMPAAKSSSKEDSAVDPPSVAPGSAGGNERGYVVVRVGLDDARPEHEGFRKVAALASERHRAAVMDWAGTSMAGLRSRLGERNPENVLFVLPPEKLDLVLHRRILMLCHQLDADWFCDFAFGYLTAADGDKVQALWQRIEQVRQHGELSGTWLQASVTVGDKTLYYRDGAPPLAKSAGFEGAHYYYKPGRPEDDELVMRSLQEMQDAQVLKFTGCGDPTGIWLFDDHRNVERDRHWDYDPALVGQDPDGSMPRLLPSHFRGLKLTRPILWSGTCHSGAVQRVYVEGDIVSTFGRTKNATVHVMQPEDSLALAWLDAGAASLLVPLGANHGMSVSMEVDFALRNGASLGEVLQSTYNDVLLAAEGKLALDLPVAGEPHPHAEPVMQGGGANRILIGDPALRPFRAVASEAERVGVQRTEAGLRVTVTRAAGWQPRAWDMFGQDRSADYRALVRVDLTAMGLKPSQCEAMVTATTPRGQALPYALRRCALERHAGRVYLHLQANGARAALDRKAAKVVFDVACSD